MHISSSLSVLLRAALDDGKYTLFVFEDTFSFAQGHCPPTQLKR